MDTLKVKLEDVEKYGELLTPIRDMAYLLDVDEVVLEAEINDLTSPMRKAYMRGKAHTANELRDQLLSNAMAGSPSSIIEILQQINSLNC